MITISNTGTHKVEIAGYAPEEEKETVYTPLEFLRLFTSAERTLMRTSTDDIVLDFLWMADKAQDLKLSDPDTIAGINYMASIGILTAERAEEILL